MKKSISILATLLLAFSCVLFFSGSASAADREVLFFTEPYSDGVKVTGCMLNKNDTIVVPEQIHEKPVRCIDEGAFAKQYGLRNVVLPEGLKTIRKGAFQSCGSLASIELPESLQTVGESAFDSCGMLSSVHFPHNLARHSIPATTIPHPGNNLPLISNKLHSYVCSKSHLVQIFPRI